MKEIKHTWLDEEIVKAINGGTAVKRDAALFHFFSDEKLFNTVKQYILSQGGTMGQCEDIFQDVFILFERNLRAGKFKGDSSLSTYFMGIVKNHWLSEKRKKMVVVEYDVALFDAEIASIETVIIADEETKILEDALAQLGKKCHKMILLTGISDSNAEIADILGFSSPDMARKEVYRCREKFRQFISKHPHLETVLKSIIRK
jgi:RNA polymerase sigma factor (sigma-70 family)